MAIRKENINISNPMMISTWDNRQMTFILPPSMLALLLHNDKVVKEAKALSAAFHKKGDEFKDILKMGAQKARMQYPWT
jgi:aspartate ammonia-lyase